jgi:hypothetical protein
MLPGFGLQGGRCCPEVVHDIFYWAESSAASAKGARCDLNMLEKVFNLFGCRHTRLSVPFSMETARQNQAHLDWSEELPTGCSHYVVCLDCGRRFGYDWSEMKVIKTRMKAAG